ncbi:hypothetical protein L1887_58049 [Cichorium endivia]|nr:hypothetical protein L1887_58049 [Cichorium endivia]
MSCGQELAMLFVGSDVSSNNTALVRESGCTDRSDFPALSPHHPLADRSGLSLQRISHLRPVPRGKFESGAACKGRSRASIAQAAVSKFSSRCQVAVPKVEACLACRAALPLGNPAKPGSRELGSAAAAKSELGMQGRSLDEKQHAAAPSVV